MNKKIIFVGYEPDINSGGNSMIPKIIKTINKMYNNNIIYFFILFNCSFKDNKDMFLKMNLYSEEYLPIATQELINDKNNICICTEGSGNPLNFNNIVRFNFYFNISEPSLTNEYNVFFASPFFKLYNETREKCNTSNNIIFSHSNVYSKYINYIYNYDDIFSVCIDYGQSREGSCYTIRKGAIHPHNRTNCNYHPIDSFAITHEISNIFDLCKIFNKYKYFYCYDGFTNILQFASLCGCIPIIVPFSNYSLITDFWKEEWFTYGIAYGNSEDQINYAINTRDKLKDSLIKMKTYNYNNRFQNLIESIYTHFDNNKIIDNILVDILTDNDNNNENIIIVYKLRYIVNNNKILILTNKINSNNINKENFIIDYVQNEQDIEKILKSNEYNFIFTEKKIIDFKYRYKTHFYLNIDNSNHNKLNLMPYRYCSPKYVNNNLIQTYVNLNNDYNITIPPSIYDYRTNYGTSNILWAASSPNISNNHWIIQTINCIGFKHYKRKNNLINAFCYKTKENLDKFSNQFENPLNICIYQETEHNPLNMKNKVYFNWFFDSFRNKYEHDIDSLYIYQFPFYSIKENVLKQRYTNQVDINHYNEYPNCFPCIFNIELLLKLSQNNNNKNRKGSCHVFRKTLDSHPLKMMNSIKEYFIHPDDSICIDNNNLHENIEIFLKSEKFYCYDNVSFLPIISIICGCKPILIDYYPGFNNIKELYKIYAPWMSYCDYKSLYNNLVEFDFNKNRENLIKLLIDINNNKYKNFTTEQSCYESLLIFLQYLECFFNVSFNE